MNCPECNGNTKVVDRRTVRRRRECLVCNHRFSTIELLANQVKQQIEVAPKIKVQKTETPKPTRPKKEPVVTLSAVKRNADARRKIEEMRDLRNDFDFLDPDYDYLPEKW